MGFSTSGAAAIIFVGMLVAVSIAFPVIETAHDRQSGAMSDRDDRALDVRNTAIAVDTGFDGDGNLVVDVENTGTTTLSVNETDLLVDGTYLPRSEYDTSVDGVSDRTTVQPGETLTFETAEAAVDRVKVVTGNGVAETVTGV